MSISPKNNEQIIQNFSISWWSYKVPVFCFFALNIALYKSSHSYNEGTFIVSVVISAIPAVLVYIINKNRKYILTNKRLYLEEGVLGKRKKDLPLNKLNDIEVHQSFFQRVFGAGDLVFLTGNDAAKKITDIANPDAIKEKIATASQYSNDKQAA